MKSNSSKKFLFVTFSLVLVALTRFLPHPPNFTAVGALALFGGAMYGSNLLRFLVPFSIMFLTDLILNNVVYRAFYDGFVWFTSGAGYIYGGFALMVVLGTFLTNNVNLKSVVGAGLIGSVAFFLITNFGVWAASNGMYPATAEGLIACYVAGVPFLLNTVAGTLLFSGVLFGIYAYMTPKLLLEEVKVKS